MFFDNNETNEATSSHVVKKFIEKQQRIELRNDDDLQQQQLGGIRINENFHRRKFYFLDYLSFLNL